MDDRSGGANADDAKRALRKVLRRALRASCRLDFGPCVLPNGLGSSINCNPHAPRLTRENALRLRTVPLL